MNVLQNPLNSVPQLTWIIHYIRRSLGGRKYSWLQEKKKQHCKCSKYHGKNLIIIECTNVIKWHIQFSLNFANANWFTYIELIYGKGVLDQNKLRLKIMLTIILCLNCLVPTYFKIFTKIKLGFCIQWIIHKLGEKGKMGKSHSTV